MSQNGWWYNLGHRAGGCSDRFRKVIMTKYQEIFIKNLGGRMRKLADLYQSAFDGDMNAAIKINCLTCKTYDAEAVRNCHHDICVFWVSRPFQDKNSND